ncbi:hypothetical protein HDU93_009882, partial [Gonapodya sp. JEL0774]
MPHAVVPIDFDAQKQNATTALGMRLPGGGISDPRQAAEMLRAKLADQNRLKKMLGAVEPESRDSPRTGSSPTQDKENPPPEYYEHRKLPEPAAGWAGLWGMVMCAA